MTTQNESRLDRVEHILEQIAARQDRTDKQISLLAEVADRAIAANAEQIAALSTKIDQFVHEMGFLRAAMQGHISQSTPPAHQE